MMVYSSISIVLAVHVCKLATAMYQYQSVIDFLTVEICRWNLDLTPERSS